MLDSDNTNGMQPTIRKDSILRTTITWQDVISKYPLSHALSKNDSLSVCHNLLRDCDAAKMVFVKRPRGRSFICTIHPAAENESNHHIPDDTRASIDSALCQYIESISITTQESPMGQLISNKQKKIDVNTFISGDLVVLKANVVFSSQCKQGSVTFAASDACLGDHSWGRLGVVQSMKTKAGGEQIIRVREFLHDSVSVYSEDDLRFADGSSLDDDGSNFTSSKLYTSSHPTHAAVGTTVPLLPVNITVDSSNSKDNMLNEDMNSYWQSDISGGRPWIQITLPPRAGTGAVFPELQLYTMDHDIYSPNNISISTGADSSSLVKLKDMTLSTASQWNTLVTSDEFKNAAAAKGPVRVVRISITDNHSGGGESRVSGVRLVNTAVPQFSRQLSVGERVVLSPSFSENQGDGWCLGKVSDVKTGVIICVPDTPSKFTEQRDIVVLSDDNDDKSLQLSVFRASWLERSPPPIDLIPGQLVQLNPATWRDDNIHTNVKCLGVLEDKRFGVVLSTGSLCKGILRNVEVALVNPSSSVSGQDEHESTPVISLYPSTALMLTHPSMILTEDGKTRLKGLLQDYFPATVELMNIDTLLRLRGIKIFSLLSASRGVAFVLPKIRTWISQMDPFSQDASQYLIPTVFQDVRVAGNEESTDTVVESLPIIWGCKRSGCGYADNPMRVNVCIICNRKGKLWTCVSCQASNKVNALECSSCSTKKTTSEKFVSELSVKTNSNQLLLETTEDTWICVLCRQANIGKALICKECCVRKPYSKIFQPFTCNPSCVESAHPYANNTNTYTTVEVPGATEVLVYFDKQSSTENGHDYVKLYKDDSHTSYWGEEKYTGNVFPGTNNRPPLRIPSNHFVVHFHSDGSSVGWGYNIMTIAAPSEEPRVTPPYQIPPADIASKGLAESMVFESSHPYSENTDEYTVVEIPGAMGYSISFDPQSCTETNFDFVRFYKDDTHTERWGEDKYSGSGSSKNFPGCEDRPPLEIPSDRFVIYFHSDGSHNSWGYKLTATKATVFIPKVFSMGDKVVRGKDWKWGNQDGGEGKTGVVVGLPDISMGLIAIQWDSSGNIYSYRYGNDNFYDIKAVDSESTITDTDAMIVSAIALDNKLRNSDGVLVHLGSESENSSDIGEQCSNVYYCGRTMKQCRCGSCDGRCGPTKGCPCDSCKSLLDGVVTTVSKSTGSGSRHPGEYRNKPSMECHCALDEKSFLGSKYRCFHSGFVRGHHWSCCGATDETAAGCLTSPLLTSIISLFPDSGALHRGMMKCKCNHVIDRLTSPLDKDRHHLANTCLWECCNASWEVSLCTTSSTVSSLKAQVSLITNFDKMLVSGVGDFTPCCSNEHPMVKLSKAEFSLQSKNSLHEEGNDSDDDDDEVNIKDRSNGLKVTCDICNKVDISDESHVYSCRDCSYYMCESCVIKLQELLSATTEESELIIFCSLNHEFKKILHIQFLERNISSNLAAPCSGCSRTPFGENPIFYHCNECKYGLCIYCALSSCRSQGKPIRKFGDSYVVESLHPYKNNTNTYTVVEIPGQIGCVLQFDPLCSLESEHDFIRIYKDDIHKDYWGEKKYTGGFLGTSKNFPGVGNTLPLLIPSNRFVVHFHSDSCKVDWGYKIKITSRMKRNINLTPESFVDIPDARKLLAWNIYLEAIKRVGATATTSVPTQHTKTDANMDEDSDIESDDSPSKDSELLLNNSDELAITSAADMLPSVSRRASSIRMKSIHDYEPIDNIRSLLVVKDRDNNTVLHHTALIGLQSSYNKLVTCGASPWLMNSKGQTAAGLLVGIKGHVNQFQLHRACLRHNFLDEDLTTAALRCPVDYDLPDELLRVWTLINDRRADDAIAYAGSLDTNNKIAVSDHYQIFVTLATFLAGYSEKTTLLKLSAYETYARSKLHDMSFYLHPVYFYVRYRLSMQTPPKGKIARNRAADGLSASKSFTKLSKRFLTVKDDIDDVVEAEIKDQNKFDEDSDENDDVELEDEEFTPDAPELEWLEVKKEVGKSSPSMDKLMALTGLKEVKKKAMAVYKEVLLTPLRPKYLDSRTTMNFLFVGNPGTGKTTVSELLAAAMVEIGFRINPTPFLTNAGDILKAKDPAGEFETLVNKAIGGTVFIDEAYLFKPSPRGQTANASNAVLDCLLKVAEEKRETTTFILAGYKDDIEDLLTYNEGFTSRFPKQFTFPFEDYDESHLRRILKNMVTTRGFLFETKKQCKVNLPKVLSRRIARGIGTKGFGNAREVRNRIDHCVGRQAARLGSLVLKKDAQSEKLSKDDTMIRTLTLSDTIGDRPDFTHSTTMKELNAMIGLVAVKSAINGLMELQLQNYDREVRGEKIEQISLHRVFFGNPGTGKTTVAKIYGNLLKEFGFLSDGSVIQVTGSDLIGDAVGVSSTKTAQLLTKAKGKVLFIDEAYVLDPTRRGNSYGGNALDTLVEKIQANEGSDMAVILAGYESEMRDLFRNCGNAGLSRRFNLSEAIRFEDFSDDELKRILNESVARAGLAMFPETATAVVRIVARGRRLDGFGNAGAVETILGRAKLNKSKRLAEAATERRDSPLGEGKPLPNLDLLLLEDFVTEELSVPKARSQFDELWNCTFIIELIDELDATISLVRSEGKSPADLVSSSHMIFTGPPGTGKSTVARKFGSVLYNLEILPRDAVTFTTGKSMQAGHVGGTPLMVTELMGKAKGGLLVIDEAYGLYPERGNYGEEAIQTLLDNMSKPEFQGNLVVILVDQADKIEALLKINPALRSRFDKKRILFPAWTGRQATDAVIAKITNDGKFITDEGKEELFQRFCKLERLPGWSSARDVYENVLPQLYITRANRLLRSDDKNDTTAPYEVSDVDMACKSFISTRMASQKARDKVVKTKGQPPGPEDEYRHEVDHPEDFRPVIKENYNHVENEIGGDNSGDKAPAGSDEDIWGALEEACQELSYDLQQMEDIFESKNFPPELLDLMRLKTKKLPEVVRTMLTPQCDRLLKQVRRVREQMATAKSQEEHAKQEKLRKLGRCPMHFEWLKVEGGYRCAGGSHFCSDNEIESISS